ncbi:MAG: hypothetical protein HOP10_03035 [Chitinophagaceae bacterium]|nr:hypothetical protein [Chitinophagaceae bacterium]
MKKVFKQSQKSIIALILFCVSLLLLTGKSHSQSCVDTATTEIVAINNKYDSAFFLTFDIKIIYNSDTLFANTDSAEHTHSEITGTYTFHGKKALYKLGDIEYMQNDSFTIAVYNTNKFILIGKPAPGQLTSMFVPTRVMVDSLMAQAGQQYSCQFTAYDTLKRLTFIATDSSLTCERLEIEYDPDTYYLLNIKYRIKDLGYQYPSGSGQAYDYIRRADLTFVFQNYRVEAVGAEIFSETKYLFFDGPAEIKPADAYKGYTIYQNN